VSEWTDLCQKEWELKTNKIRMEYLEKVTDTPHYKCEASTDGRVTTPAGLAWRMNNILK